MGWLDEAPPHLHSSARANYLAARRELYELLGADQTARSIIEWAQNNVRGRTTPEELRQLARDRAAHHRLSKEEGDALERMLVAYGGADGPADIYDTFQHRATARAKEQREFYAYRARICIIIAAISLMIGGGFALAEYNVLFWTFAVFAALMAVYSVHQWGKGEVKAVKEFARGAAVNEPAADAPDDRETYIHTLQTSKGHLIITWAAARPDIRAALQHSPDAAARPILAKLAEILKAHPDADLKKYEKTLGIELREVERTWDIQQDPLVKLAETTVSRARSIIEIEALRAKFLAEHDIQEGHPAYGEVREIFDAAIEAITAPERI